eukprot:718334-Rhodomonas_salina.1
MWNLALGGGERFVPEASEVGGCVGARKVELPHLHPEIESKKPQFQYNLFQECSFLCLISGRTAPAVPPSS